MELHLRNAYQVFQTKGADKKETSFRTPYWQLKYRVMPLGLMNALATFKAYIDDYWQPYTDDFVVWYLDDIVIYSTNDEEHDKQVQKVLEWLWEFDLCGIADKFHCVVSEIGCPRYVICPDGITKI